MDFWLDKLVKYVQCELRSCMSSLTGKWFTIADQLQQDRAHLTSYKDSLVVAVRLLRHSQTVAIVRLSRSRFLMPCVYCIAEFLAWPLLPVHDISVSMATPNPDYLTTPGQFSRRGITAQFTSHRCLVNTRIYRPYTLAYGTSFRACV